MRLAVIGGGINGAGIAWELARRDYDVTLFEKGRCGAQTSSATTKMIHGGIRYLERFHFGLVRESLRDRAWLLEHLPSLVKPIEILLPVYDDSPRSRLTIRVGLTLYDVLAGRENIARHQALSADELIARVPLTPSRTARRFCLLGRAGRRLRAGAARRRLRDRAKARRCAKRRRVVSLRRSGKEWIVGTAAATSERFDFVVNAAGPWMNELLAENRIRSRYRLSLVRGSHLVLKHRVADAGMLLQSISDRRVFFVLPWKGTTLVGTTEVMHSGSLENVSRDGGGDRLPHRAIQSLSSRADRARRHRLDVRRRPSAGRPRRESERDRAATTASSAAAICSTSSAER